MNKYITFVSAALLLVVLSGCGATAKMIAAKTQSEKIDVFTEVSGTEPVPAGYADVIIRADIKTHLEGYYLCESRKSAHGKETYPFLINIDGQAVLWNVAGVKHVLPKYVDGKTSRDPEAGEGIRYALSKRIRLRAGSHRIFFGLPEDDYYRETIIIVKDGESETLEFKPFYKYKTYPTRIPTYLKGISRYDILVAGKPAT